MISLGLWHFLGVELEGTDAAKLSLLLRVLMLLPMTPLQDHYLRAFLAKLSPQHREIATRGRELRTLLSAYLEQQRVSVRLHCTLPAVLETIVTAYAAPTPGDMWTDWLQWM